MSKFVKNLVVGDLQNRLDGVEEALLVNVIGLDANRSVVLRKQLREKDIQLLVVKNSMARRATEGTALAPMMEGMEGTLAIMWGADNIVSLAKEASRISREKDYAAFEARGGVMDGEPMTAERVMEISKWPSREEQLSILVGQILSPGGQLAAALVGPGSALASQIKSKAEDDE